jgi:flavin reductase (DIM6/NTAB) family NADH-FMN oxidoreductase RutF
VTVVTTSAEPGYRGITVTAFCIVCLAPPRVMISLSTANETLAALLNTRHFAVSILSDTQEFLAERFAGRAPLVNSRFDGVKHRLSRGGVPVLEECLAWFDCVVGDKSVLGDYTIVLGHVQEAGYGNGGEALLYYDGAYRFLQIG